MKKKVYELCESTNHSINFFFLLAGIISLLDEEEPQLKVRTGSRVVDQAQEDADKLMYCHVKRHSEV